MFEAAQVGLRCFLYSDTSFNLISIWKQHLFWGPNAPSVGLVQVTYSGNGQMKLDLKSQWREEWKKDATSFPLTKAVENKYIKFKDRKQQGNSHHKFSFKFARREAKKLETAPGSPGNIHCLVGGGIVVVPLCKPSHVPSVQVELFAWLVLSANPHQVEG